MRTNDGWIKMSERKPTLGDMPAWMGSVCSVVLWDRDDYTRNIDNHGWNHWQPATLPEPPAKELTQADKDEAGFRDWIRGPVGWPDGAACWHAALAYRDKQNAEDLKPFVYGGQLKSEEWDRRMNNLRRRCGLDQ